MTANDPTESSPALPRRALVAGATATLPLLLGVVPLGLIVGVNAANAGLTPSQTVGMSLLVFAGAAQLAVVGLVGQSAPLAVVVLTAVVINVRHVMYSASIAPYVRRFDPAAKWLAPYFLNDETYAVSITGFRDADPSARDRQAFYFGSGLAMLAAWVASTAAGAVFGASLRLGLSFDFAVPLVYLALLFSTLDDTPGATTAAVAGVVSVLAASLPLHLGLVVASLVGVVTGVTVEVLAGDFPTADPVASPADERDGPDPGEET